MSLNSFLKSPDWVWRRGRNVRSFLIRVCTISLGMIAAACAGGPVEEDPVPYDFDPYYDSFTYFNGGYFTDGIADDDWYYDFYEWSDLRPYYGAFGPYDPEADRFEWEEEITLE